MRTETPEEPPKSDPPATPSVLQPGPYTLNFKEWQRGLHIRGRFMNVITPWDPTKLRDGSSPTNSVLRSVPVNCADSRTLMTTLSAAAIMHRFLLSDVPTRQQCMTGPSPLAPRSGKFPRKFYVSVGTLTATEWYWATGQGTNKLDWNPLTPRLTIKRPYP